MSSSKRKKEQSGRKNRLCAVVILLIFTLSVFIYAIWHVVNNGYTYTTTIYGIIMAALLFVTGYIGGPLLNEWTEQRKLKRTKSIKNGIHSKS